MKGNWTRVRDARGARENPRGKRGLVEGLKERVEEFTKTRHFPRVRGVIKGEESGRQWIETATLTRAGRRVAYCARCLHWQTARVAGP